jgi:hypothetical protein
MNTAAKNKQWNKENPDFPAPNVHILPQAKLSPVRTLERIVHKRKRDQNRSWSRFEISYEFPSNLGAKMETESRIDKLNAELLAVSLVVSELIAENMRKDITSTRLLDNVAQNTKQFLSQFRFGSDSSAQEVTAWVDERAKTILNHAKDRLKKR